MATSNLTSKEFGRRFRKALSVPFLLNQVCSSSVKDFVTSYAASLGCSEKCFFFPFLSCAASCMGTDACMEIAPGWQEPPVVWTLVITPVSLQRIDVAEHLKQQLLDVQNEVSSIEKTDSKLDDSSKHIPKFVLDMFTFDQLHEMLKLSHGHGIGLYNSARVLHNLMTLPHELEIMMRLQSGSAWFSDSRVTKSTLSKTRVNFAILSTPSAVHQTLTTAPNFQELFQQCFLTACAEENHVKFAQFSSTTTTEASQLKKIFQSLLTLHSSGTAITYKLSTEANEKFGQIHDELTDKAKQMVRKNAHKVFHPALSYLGRLSCVLHVLDNIIEAVTWNLPLDPLTFNTEISAATVWHARELLGHIIEQRHALMEQTMIEPPSTPSQQKSPRSVSTPAIDLVDLNPTHSMQSPRTPRTPIVSQRMTSNHTTSPNFISTRGQNQGTFQRGFYNTSARRNIMTRTRVSSNRAFDTLLNDTTTTNGDPRIVSVRSAGLPVPGSDSTFNPIITGCESVNSNSSNSALPQNLNLPPSLSVSVTGPESSQPPLLSRVPPSSDILLQSTQSSSLAITDEEFLRSFRVSIRRLLMHGVTEISPSRCVQLRLTPDPIGDGSGDSSKQQYTSSFARSFLKKLEILGFGTCEGPTSNNMRHFLFKKTSFTALGEKQKRMLTELRVSEREYDKCFSAANKQSTQNGSIVCLE